MSTQTTNYNLTKQTGAEHFSMPLINENFDKIDTQLKINTNDISKFRDDVLHLATYQNSWTSYHTTYNPIGYWRNGNTVHIQGFIKGGTLGTTIFTLPVGYRPQKQIQLLADSGGAAVQIIIAASGEVKTYSGFTAGNWLSLDNISFYSPIGITITDLENIVEAQLMIDNSSLSYSLMSKIHFEDGMTWQDFCTSEYSNHLYSVVSGSEREFHYSFGIFDDQVYATIYDGSSIFTAAIMKNGVYELALEKIQPCGEYSYTAL